MNLKRNVSRSTRFPVVATVLTLAVLGFFGMGCGGLGASGSVSPATFLLPGLGQHRPAETQEGVLEPVSAETPSLAAFSADPIH